MSSRRFDRFIRALAETRSETDLANPWLDDETRANRIRRANLRRYFHLLDGQSPSTIFVGEALGHRGGRISGVPFTSIELLLHGSGPLLGSAYGYDDPGDAGGIRREASATMIWNAIHSLPAPPLLWNACPFHPHQPGNPRSNRRPRSAEVEIGGYFLARLARLFGIETFVAVGRVASESLESMGVSHVYVRHPSLGGKRKFEQGLETLFG